MSARAWVALGVLALCGTAFGQDATRPDEAELFGTPQKMPDGGVPPEPGPSTALGANGVNGDGGVNEDELFGGGESTATQPAEAPAQSAAETPKQKSGTQDEAGLEAGIQDRFASGEEVEDPLDIGGMYYQRFVGTNREGGGLTKTTLSAPTLVDAYFDARPNERLRANVVARLQYDPLLSDSAIAAQALGQKRDNPSLSLDQMWLAFDIARQVFVTIGRQHVKWGTGRFWNPTDYLHAQRRDSLALFDVRVGTNMVKLHVPWEATGANLYVIGLLDNAFGDVGTIKDIGGAARAEWVLGTAEVGLDAVVQNGVRPRYGADFSSALGPIDIYGELSLRPGAWSRWNADLQREKGGDYAVAATGGLTWTFAYNENDTATVGGEYFYNPTGYDDPSLYPFLLFNNAFPFFYVGQQYASVYALLSGPGSWDKTNFILSNLANLSDRSFVSRLDFTVRVLSYLTVEANASVFYGEPTGEFRLRMNIPPSVINGQPTPAFTVPAQRFQLGLGLRMDI